MEVWKSIPGYSEIYEASTHGAIRRVKPSNSMRWKNCPLPFIIQQKKNKKGYMELSLRTEAGKAMKHRTHRLIALTFLPEPTMEKPEVNHKDLNKINNHLSNLEYCTRKQNWNHALSFNSIMATVPRGEAHWSAKLSDEDVSKIRQMLASNIPQKEIAALFSVRPNTISRIKTGVRRAPFVPK